MTFVHILSDDECDDRPEPKEPEDDFTGASDDPTHEDNGR